MRTGAPAAHLTGRATRPVVYQMAYFPPDEYEHAWAQGLLDATSYRDHRDYRRETQQTMQALAEGATTPVRVVRLVVTDLLAYAQRTGNDPASRQTRLAYTDWLHEQGHTSIAWPPERNALCWCGSGGKYKKCCGNPVFLAVQPPDPASLVLRIELDGLTPRVWRRIAVPSNTMLDHVHRMIQDAMGWYDEHMYAFETEDHTILDPRSDHAEYYADAERLVSIAAEPGATFTYEYDFGDSWIHTVTLEEIRSGGLGNAYALLDGAGACPPEDIGGVAWYQHLLDALADPTNPDHEDAVERLGEDYDPARWPGAPVGQA